MKLLDSKLMEHPDKYLNTWIADSASEITPGFDEASYEGSMIVCIDSKDTYFKNSANKWQKFGTAEVI